MRPPRGLLYRQRGSLAALTPVLVGDPNEGLFTESTSFSRQRVQAVFLEAVQSASDAPKPEDAAALGRVLYVAHLAVILWWLLDKSPEQRATTELVALLERGLPLAAVALRIEPARALVRSIDGLCQQALVGAVPRNARRPSPSNGT